MSDEAPAYPMTLTWGAQTETATTPEALAEHLVMLWQMREEGVKLRDADGAALDAGQRTREALQAFYGG